MSKVEFLAGQTWKYSRLISPLDDIQLLLVQKNRRYTFNFMTWSWTWDDFSKSLLTFLVPFLKHQPKASMTNFIREKYLYFSQIFVEMARSVKFQFIIQSPWIISHLLIAIRMFIKLQRIFYIFYPIREISQGRFDHIVNFNWSKREHLFWGNNQNVAKESHFLFSPR